jgi:hypothetical protein
MSDLYVVPMEQLSLRGMVRRCTFTFSLFNQS